MPILYSGQNRKNAIINGDFKLWSQTPLIEDGCGADKNWMNRKSANYFRTVSIGEFTPEYFPPLNPKYYSRTEIHQAGTSAGDFCTKYAWVDNARTFAGETVTLSFLARATPAAPIATEIVRSYGTGGTPSSPDFAIAVTTHNLTVSLALYSVTFKMPSLSGKTIGTDPDTSYLEITFWFGGGSDFNARNNSLGNQSGTFDLTYVQLERGSVATPFELRPISEEERLIQRYEEQAKFTTGGNTVAGNYECCDIQFRMPKRVPPTIFTLMVDESFNMWFTNIFQHIDKHGTNVVLAPIVSGQFYFTAFVYAYSGFASSEFYNPYGTCRAMFPGYDTIFMNMVNTAIAFEYGRLGYYSGSYTKGNLAGASNSSNNKGVIGGGNIFVPPTGYYVTNSMEYTTINLPESTAVDWGDLLDNRAYMGAASNSTGNVMIFGGGASTFDHGDSWSNVMHRKTMNTGSNATNHGILSQARNRVGGTSNGINNRAVFAGGYYEYTQLTQRYYVTTNIIDYTSINTTPYDAGDFGDLISSLADVACVSNFNGNRAVFAGGNWNSPGPDVNDEYPVNYMSYVNIASLGNATDFGNLTGNRHSCAGAANSLSRAIFAGGSDGSAYYGIDHVYINTLQQHASTFGSLSSYVYHCGMTNA